MFTLLLKKTSKGRCLVSFFVVLLMMLSLSGCQSTGPSFPHDMDTLVLDVPPKQQGENDSFDVYRITPGDQLDVFFYFPVGGEDENFTISVDHKLEIHFINAPELDQIQSVRPDGMISMPYIGQVKVIGKKVGELTKLLEKKYSKILREAKLYILLSEFRNKIHQFKKDLHTSERGLSRKLHVRPDGLATFPYLGEVSVVGRTLNSVNQELNEKYEAIFAGLNVNLSLDKQAGSMVYVLGEVNKPGGYQMQRPITALEAISLAGGYNASAKLEQVVALRRLQDQVQARRIDLVKALRLEDQQYFLRPDDVLFVPKSALFSNSEIATHLSNILLFRGWGLNYSWDAN